MRVRRPFTRMLACALMAASPTAAAPPAPRFDLSAITAELDRQCTSGTFSGVVVIRVRGREILNRACGQADIVNGIANSRATRFKIYSISKFITALAIMKLVETGKLSLDVPAARYLPELPAEWGAVTIRQLLNHTSGIADLTGQLVTHFRTDHPAAMRDALAALTPEQRALKTAPGATFAYSNFGFELLAGVATRAGGKPFADLVTDLVFTPAGMATASIEQPNMELGHPVAVNEDGLAIGYNGAPDKLQQATNWAFIQLGAGAIRANVDDFLALDTALHAGRIVAPATLAEMVRGEGQAPNPYRLGVVVNTIDGVRMEGHTGGTNGYIADFQRYPDDGAVMIALTNRGFAKTRWLREGVAKMLTASR